IKDTKVNMTIYPAICECHKPQFVLTDPDVDSNTQAFNDQLKAVTSAITTYGEEYIEGVRIKELLAHNLG
ncbi:hypothetical protein NY486_06990, partial [Enterobacter hormaechei]|nr:hypothetical protein [Enterobacter hormaechei]